MEILKNFDEESQERLRTFLEHQKHCEDLKLSKDISTFSLEISLKVNFEIEELTWELPLL